MPLIGELVSEAAALMFKAAAFQINWAAPRLRAYFSFLLGKNSTFVRREACFRPAEPPDNEVFPITADIHCKYYENALKWKQHIFDSFIQEVLS